LSERSQETVPPRGDDERPQGPRGLLRRGSVDTRAKRWAIAAACAVTVLGAGFMITRSPVFAARHIDVTGASHLSRAAVLRVAGVGRGTNVFWFRAGTIRRRLERDPWIERADVTRSLPSTISIRIVERAPVAVVPERSGGYAVVASDGVVLGRSTRASGLPALLVDPTRPRVLGSAARVAGGMDPWLREHVRAIDATSGSLVIRLVSGIPAYYGDATAAAAKDRALAAVLRWAIQGAKPVQAIDVRAPLAPTAQLPSTPAVPVPAPSSPSKGKKHPASKASTSPSPSPAASPRRSPSVSPSPSPDGTRKHRKHTRRHRRKRSV